LINSFWLFGFGFKCKNWIDNPNTKSNFDFGLSITIQCNNTLFIILYVLYGVGFLILSLYSFNNVQKWCISTWSKALRTLPKTSFQWKELHFICLNFNWEKLLQFVLFWLVYSCMTLDIFLLVYHTLCKTWQSQYRCPRPLKVCYNLLCVFLTKKKRWCCDWYNFNSSRMVWMWKLICFNIILT